MDKLKELMVPYYFKLIKFYTLYIIPYRYEEERYPDSYVSKKIKNIDITLERANEILYIFWTGGNEITENRKKSIQSIKEKAGVEVVLVTSDNLNEYILDNHPLHKAYKYLSLIHRSDYLRCYFMLHHGGGYVDIKPCLNSWKGLFQKLNKSDAWYLGTREKFPGGVANIEGVIGADCKKYYSNLIANGGYIFKPNSPIAFEWMDEIHVRLDYFMDDLIKNPGDAFGSGDYPIPWAYLAGCIIAPLTLKYNEKVIIEDIDLYAIKDYR